MLHLFHSQKSPRVIESSFVSLTHIFDQDFSAKLETVEEYSEYHYGLKSVLDDIIQLDANQSKIDTIDCI